MATIDITISEPPPLRSDENGTIYVGATRVPIDTVIGEYMDGASADEIVLAYDALNLADVHGAISFFLRHREEVEAYLQESKKASEEVRRENERRFPTEGLYNKLVARRFTALAERWREDTEFLSSITQKSMHPAYQEIIGMGRTALPCIFRELKSNPDHWFWALRAITGESPIKPEHSGRMREMASDWLQWGKEHGYPV